MDINTILIHFGVQQMLRKGFRSDRHIVVFESDDWGSIRIPSKESLKRLKNKGICGGNSYDYNDTLASESDIINLLDVLDRFQTDTGHKAMITLNMVMANPDFDKIRNSGFSEYFYEPFTTTLLRYPHHKDSFCLLQQGISQSYFYPQFHCREHLNASRWMRLLKAGNSDARAAFDENIFCLDFRLGDSDLTNILATYDAEIESDYKYCKSSIEDGLNLFEILFGFRSKSMVAPRYTIDPMIENFSLPLGISQFQCSTMQRHSEYYRIRHARFQPRYMGQRGKGGQLYTIRNCAFEPAESKRHNADVCLSEIDKQFQLGHPAVVSCHRQNFIGELNPRNRDENLKQFAYLLRRIVEHWPDVEFLSSDRLGDFIMGGMEE